MHPTYRRQKGFTLLEIIVVIVILGVLAGIAIPTFSAAVAKSQDSVAQEELAAFQRQAWANQALDTAGGYTYASFPTSSAFGPGVLAAALSPLHRIADGSASTRHGDASVYIASSGAPSLVSSLAQRSDSGHCVFTQATQGAVTSTKVETDSSVACVAGYFAPPTPQNGPSASGSTQALGWGAQIAVSWPADPTIQTYTLMRTSDLSSTPVQVFSGPYSALPACPSFMPGGSCFTDNSLSYGRTYTYTVSERNEAGSASLPPATAFTAPSSPTNLSASIPAPSSATSSTPTIVTWNPSSNARSYAIFRSTDGSSYTLLASSVGATNFTDSTTVPGQVYYYIVSGVNEAGPGPYSSPAQALSTPYTPVLTGSTTSSSALALSWTSINGATGYALYRSDKGATVYQSLSASTTSFTDSSLPSGTTYSYSVVAQAPSAPSPSSNTVTLATLTAPVTVVAGVSNTSSSINISWSGVTGSSSYTLLRSQSSNMANATTVLSGVTGGSYSGADGGLAANTAYYYQVISYNATGLATYGAVAGQWTRPYDLPAPGSSCLCNGNINDAIAGAENVWWASEPNVDYHVNRTEDGQGWARIYDGGSTNMWLPVDQYNWGASVNNQWSVIPCSTLSGLCAPDWSAASANNPTSAFWLYTTTNNTPRYGETDWSYFGTCGAGVQQCNTASGTNMYYGSGTSDGAAIGSAAGPLYRSMGTRYGASSSLASGKHYCYRVAAVPYQGGPEMASTNWQCFVAQ